MSKPTTTVTLGAHFDALVAELVADGQYSDASEVVVDALQLLEKARDEYDQRVVDEALADEGEWVPHDEVVAELRRRAVERAAGQR